MPEVESGYHIQPEDETTDRQESEEEMETLERDIVAEGASSDAEDKVHDKGDTEMASKDTVISRDNSPETDPKPVPPPRQPRRPVRERRPPQKFDEYYMYQMVPKDPKLQALDILVKSGILDEVDGETAHRLIGAIMK